MVITKKKTTPLIKEITVSVDYNNSIIVLLVFLVITENIVKIMSKMFVVVMDNMGIFGKIMDFWEGVVIVKPDIMVEIVNIPINHRNVAGMVQFMVMDNACV